MDSILVCPHLVSSILVYPHQGPRITKDLTLRDGKVHPQYIPEVLQEEVYLNPPLQPMYPLEEVCLNPRQIIYPHLISI